MGRAGNVISLIELSAGKNFAGITKSGGINTFWYQPAKVFLCDRGEEASSKEVSDGITKPSNGFITLKIIW